MPPEPQDPAVVDLRWLLRLGLLRGGALLTAGEQHVIEQILSLTGPAASAHARLTARVPSVFALDRLTIPGVSDPGPATAILVQRQLADHLVPWPVRAAALTRPELVAALRRLGLPRSGRKAELVERLRPHTGWHPARWIRIRHRALIRRLERWAMLRPWPDRSTLVISRMGVIRWPDYQPQGRPALHPDRRALLAWEALLSPELSVEGALEALARGHARAPGGLDLSRHLRHGIREVARELERRGEPGLAAELYQRLVAEGGAALPRIAFRWSRAEEAAGRPERALELLLEARSTASPVDALALSRAGRRLSRSLRRGWAPDPPLHSAPRRSLRLPQAPGATGRERWSARAVSIEQAVCDHLAERGRIALHGEGRAWSTLFALLFAETYFLPIPGALPVPFLTGPLDLGTPGFRAARREATDAVLEAIARGEAPQRIEAAHARWEGIALSGAHWDVAGRQALVDIARGLGPQGLRTILEPLLDGGRRAAAGLPDLVVLPGEPAQLPDALPRALPGGLFLAELKGPTDSLRDAQAVWIHRLVQAGVPVELWEIAPTRD